MSANGHGHSHEIGIDMASSSATATSDCCGHGHSHGAGGHGHGHGHGLDHGHGVCMPVDAASPSKGNGHAHSHELGGSQSLIDNPQHLWDSSIGWLQSHDPSECRNIEQQCQGEEECEQARCDHAELAATTNVIVMVRANELIAMSRVNSVLAISAVLYIAVNLICTILNSYDNDCDRSDPTCSPACTPQFFHNLEFCATFLFNTVDVFALSYSPKNLSTQYGNPTLLKITVLFNVGLSFLAAMLVVTNLGKFEILAHEIEYTNEFTVWFFDAVIFVSLVRGRSHAAIRNASTGCGSILVLILMGFVVVLQLGIYNLCGWTANGASKGEQAAHYLEFAFGIASAGITFWFTMDNKFSADQRLREIMYGTTLGAPLLGI